VEVVRVDILGGYYAATLSRSEFLLLADGLLDHLLFEGERFDVHGYGAQGFCP
jgi:hypothetical protein